MFVARALNLLRQRRLPDFRYWWNHRHSLWAYYDQTKTGVWRLLHADPAIIYIMAFGQEVERLSRRLGHRRACLLVSNPWIPRDAAEAETLRSLTARHQAQYPRISLVYLCNDLRESEILSTAGLRAEFCHQNAFVDEKIFRIQPHLPKQYDALYISQLVSYKRHDLAREVKSLVLASYISGLSEMNYVKAVRQQFKWAHWLYQPGVPRLSHAEMCHHINQCRVGLCLSACEGGMYASMEYLLCGLPVVTTPNVGGRNVFFEESYALTVEPNPAAVRQGVEEMIRRNLDPEKIRSAVLRKIQVHREKFTDIINRLLTEHGAPPTFQWGDRFIHKMAQSQPFSQLSREIAELNAAVPAQSIR